MVVPGLPAILPSLRSPSTGDPCDFRYGYRNTSTERWRAGTARKMITGQEFNLLQVEVGSERLPGIQGQEQGIASGLDRCCPVVNVLVRCAVIAQDRAAGRLRVERIRRDFGLARTIEPGLEGAAQATHTGSVIGTPRYMSPEQARGQKLDARTDIFSLGAVLYEMVEGRPAFPGATTAEVFAALLGSEHDAANAGPLGNVISKALAKEPAARYKSI